LGDEAAADSFPGELGVVRRELTAEYRREQTFQAFIRLVDKVADVAPLLLVAEDVHWADPSTLELLGRLADRAGRRRTMVLLTSRPGGPELPGAPIVKLSLEPLDRSHSDAMVRGLLPDDIPDSLRELIVERSDGIPLFIEELSHTLENRRPSSLTGSSLEVPPSLHDLLAARLDSFPGQKMLAQAVATIGQPAPARLVEQVVGLDAGSVGVGLEALAGAGIGWADLAAVELNEAFAAQGLQVLRMLGLGDDAAHVNPNGGAIALGHPLGMSGARLALTATEELQRSGGRHALCTMCIGVGQGIALALERV